MCLILHDRFVYFFDTTIIGSPFATCLLPMSRGPSVLNFATELTVLAMHPASYDYPSMSLDSVKELTTSRSSVWVSGNGFMAKNKTCVQSDGGSTHTKRRKLDQRQ